MNLIGFSVICLLKIVLIMNILDTQQSKMQPLIFPAEERVSLLVWVWVWVCVTVFSHLVRYHDLLQEKEDLQEAYDTLQIEVADLKNTPYSSRDMRMLQKLTQKLEVYIGSD